MKNYFKALFVIAVPRFIGRLVGAELEDYIAWYLISALWLLLDKLDELKNK